MKTLYQKIFLEHMLYLSVGLSIEMSLRKDEIVNKMNELNKLFTKIPRKDYSSLAEENKLNLLLKSLYQYERIIEN